MQPYPQNYDELDRIYNRTFLPVSDYSETIEFLAPSRFSSRSSSRSLSRSSSPKSKKGGIEKSIDLMQILSSIACVIAISIGSYWIATPPPADEIEKDPTVSERRKSRGIALVSVGAVLLVFIWLVWLYIHYM